MQVVTEDLCPAFTETQLLGMFPRASMTIAFMLRCVSRASACNDW